MIKPQVEAMKRLADYYEDTPHSPFELDTMWAYRAFKQQLIGQFRSAEAFGILLEPWQEAEQPYENSLQMRNDVIQARHLYYFMGGKFPPGHPLKECAFAHMSYNDVFRCVHDIYGHALTGHCFGPTGELRAYLAHAVMFTEESIPALAAESIAQTAWVNYGRHLRRPDGSLPDCKDGDYVPLKDRPYAEQKAMAIPLRLLVGLTK